MKIKMLSALIGASLLAPGLAQAEIVQRQVLSAIAAEQDSEGADVLTVAFDTACGGRQLRMDARSVGMDDKQYEEMKAQLAERIRARTPLLVTLAQCPAGETGEAAVPVIRKLAGCDPGACADGRARLYLDEKLFPQEKRRAPYVLVLPMPKGKLPGTWEVAVLSTVQRGRVRLAGQVDAADYVSGRLVGGYTYYYPDGQIEKQVPQDARGRQQGVASSYYPDGTLESRSQWRDGMPEGIQRSYHSTGKLREAVEFRHGGQVDGTVDTFDANGKLRTRQTMRDGKLEGELITYFPDGKISSRTQMSKGKFHGLVTYYHPDGAVRSTMTMLNDLPTGEALEFYPDGKVQTRQQYAGNGALLKVQRYTQQGVLVLERNWDKQLREQGTSRSWYANGKPELAIEYINDQRDGWSRSWGEDGSVKNECKYVAGKAQGVCADTLRSPELERKEQAWRPLN